MDQLREMRLEALVCTFLIRAHQTRVARHISGKDRGKTADSGHFSPGATKFSNRAYTQIYQSQQCCTWVKLPNPAAVESRAGRKAHGAVKDRFGSKADDRAPSATLQQCNSATPLDHAPNSLGSGSRFHHFRDRIANYDPRRPTSADLSVIA